MYVILKLFYKHFNLQLLEFCCGKITVKQYVIKMH